MSAISYDAPEDTENAFLKMWDLEDAIEPSSEKPTDIEDTKEDKPKRKVPEKTEESEDPEDEVSEDSEEDAEETDEDADKPEVEDKPKTKVVADDDHVVTVKVDGQELEVPVKDLKRLYGQEQALTRKSEEVAKTRKTVEEAGTAYMGGLTKLLENAKARFEPYSKIDFLVASKELSGDELVALRSEAEKNYADVRFLETELDGYLRNQAATQQAQLRTMATDCVKVLSDPKTGIEGWNEQTYNELRSYAISNGTPASDINQLVDPIAFKILHKAMLYDKGKAVATTKTDKTAKKIVKTTASREDTKRVITKGSGDNAMKRLTRTGDTEDAADAFLSRWADDS